MFLLIFEEWWIRIIYEIFREVGVFKGGEYYDFLVNFYVVIMVDLVDFIVRIGWKD